MIRRLLGAFAFAVLASTGVHAQLVMTHSNSQVITPANAISCNAAGNHADNSYWRSFNLCSPFGIQDEMTITEIQFGVENATPGAGAATQPVLIRIYEDPDGGPPVPSANLILLHSETINMGTVTAAVFNQVLSAPVVVPCLATVVVEIHTPNGQAAGHTFFMGSNALGQTGPSYISSVACSINEPTDLATIGFPNQQHVINVVYNTGAACAPCSGVPVDCHDPTFGSYEIVAEDSERFSRSPGLLISDALPITVDTIDVVGATGIVENLDVVMDITHAYNGDILMTLESPVGTVITLHANAGVNLQDFDCVYDDDGRLNARPFNLAERIQPSGPGTLADFNGVDPNGVWTLSITDGNVSPDVGTLNFWELRFNQPVAIPDNNPTGVSVDLDVDSANVDEIADLDVRVEVTHANNSQIAVDVSSPAGTTVRLHDSGGAAAQNLMERYDDDAGLGGFCDGFGTAIPAGPGTLADFDGESMGGTWSLQVADTVGGTTGQVERYVLMVNPVPCDSITNLGCSSDCTNGDITLSWTLPFASYAGGIEVRRNGATLAVIGGNETSFIDPAVASGFYTYEIIGDCDPGRSLVSCTVDHQIYAGETDLVFALESPDLVDSAAAIAASLTAAGQSVLTVDSLQYPCIDPLQVERVWVCCGTFPQNYSLSGPDGNILSFLTQQGVAIYLEGADIWGFDPQTTFAALDGVENTNFGNIQDGDDSLIELTGVDSGVGFSLAGMVEPYNQATNGPDNTDRLEPANVNPDVGGDQAGVIWTGFDQLLGVTYNTAIYYNSTFAPVISSAFEFGGYGGDQNALLASYVSALGGPMTQTGFLRGDVNADGSINLPDVIFVLNHLFVPNSADPPCFDSADTNDDGSLNLPDVIVLLNYQFVPMSAPPAAPGPFMCGPDPTSDNFAPCVYSASVCP